jgi:2-amino-4-hydroxy-6-hydroxymethyldihydropteridine diphosphokinase
MGSNLGDRVYYIKSAIKKIEAISGTRIKKISGIIESLPQGGPPQGVYLNGVMEIETTLAPHQLLQELQRIESSLGRVRTVKDGPRTIDLDILTYGDIRINAEALNIPHPRMLARDFILRPLSEIAPEVVKKLMKEKGTGVKGKKSPGQRVKSGSN